MNKPFKLNSRIIPRRWQIEALKLWKEKFAGTVSVVTGGGKTIFAEQCIQEYFLKFPFGKVVIIVPTTALLDQWYVSIVEDFSLSNQDIACFSGQEKPEDFTHINIFVINTARFFDFSKLVDSDIFLLADECHRAGSEINSLALRIRHNASLGISATPIRQYDDGFETKISPALGPIIYSYSYAEAYQDGIICPFELINVKVNFLPFERQKYDELSRKIAIEYSRNKSDELPETIKRLLQQRARVSQEALMRIPVAVKIAEKEREGRILLFHENIVGANKLQKLLEERNFNVTSYHTKIGPIIRRSNLSLFRKHVYDSIISCRALDEGIDIPDITSAIIVSSTSSIRQRIQRVGRVLRPSKGKEKATVYTIYITSLEEKRLQQESKNLETIAKTIWYHAKGSEYGSNINKK